MHGPAFRVKWRSSVGPELLQERAAVQGGRVKRSFDRLFRDHPREVEESYFEHMAASSKYGFRMLGCAGAAFLHALIPGVHKSTASRKVCEMADEMRGRTLAAQETRMRDAGAYDPGL